MGLYGIIRQGIRLTFIAHQYGHNFDNGYLECHTEDCLYRNEDNPDRAWCLYEDLCCK